MLCFDHKWFSLQGIVCSKFGLKSFFLMTAFLTQVDTLSNTPTNRYLCKDPKENIESTYRQTVCFQWGHSEENISEKAKCMPSLDSRLNKQCPNNGPKVFSSKVLENLVN